MYQAQLLLAELFLIAIATVSALVVSNNFEFSEARAMYFATYMVFTLATVTVILPSLQTYRSVWRFTGMADYLQILAATAAIVVGADALSFWFDRLDRSALSLPILQGSLILFFLVGARVLARLRYAAQERSVHRKATNEASSYETVLVIGLDGLTDLYLRFLAQLAHRVRIAGLLGDDDRQIGRSVHGHLILGTPEQIASALRRLEIHGVFVDRIVLTTTLKQLSPQARAALLDIKKTTNINFEFLTDRIGLARRSRDNGGISSGGTTNSFNAFSFDSEDLAVLRRRPYWRVKRASDPVAAVGLLI